MEVICKKPIILLDGAHNEDAAKRLVQSLEAYYPGQKWQFIMGVFADKEYQKIVERFSYSASVCQTFFDRDCTGSQRA